MTPLANVIDNRNDCVVIRKPLFKSGEYTRVRDEK